MNESALIRPSQDGDRDAIRALHYSAFDAAERAAVSDLAVDLLDDMTARPLLSLLAELDGRVLAHVLFTSVTVEGKSGSATGRILAPLAVAPGAQRRGMGSELVRAGLDRLRNDGVGLVFVLGHPEYYPRFGFRPAGRLGFDTPFPIPEEAADAWMVLELRPGQLSRASGRVRCCQALSRPEYW